LVYPDKLASLGWIPCNNYKTYNLVETKNTLKCLIDSKIFKDRFVPGLQAYIVRKKDFSSIAKKLIHPTFEEFKSYVHSLNFPDLKPHNDLLAADYFLNRMFGQAIVFPPLAIEQNLPSILGHSNQTLYWDRFFQNYEYKKNDYFTFDKKIE
jgi:hypothetical protein